MRVSSVAITTRRRRWGCWIGVAASLLALLGAPQARAQASAPSASAFAAIQRSAAKPSSAAAGKRASGAWR